MLSPPSPTPSCCLWRLGAGCGSAVLIDVISDAAERLLSSSSDVYLISGSQSLYRCRLDDDDRHRFLLVHEDVDAVACNRNNFFYLTKSGSGSKMLYEVESSSGNVRQHLLDSPPAPVLACTFSHVLSLDRAGCILLLDASTARLERLRLPDSLRVSTLACGWSHAVALSDHGLTFSWGSGASHRLGHDDEEDRTTPTLLRLLSCVLAVSVSCGYDHTLLLDDGGRVYSWGSNRRGQCGVACACRRQPSIPPHRLAIDHDTDHDTDHDIDHIDHDIDHEGVHDHDGDHGDNGYEACLRVQGEPRRRQRRVHSLSAGAFHSAAVDDGRDLLVWGCNAHGQLGLGDFVDRRTPRLLRSLCGRRVSAVSCSSTFTIVCTERVMAPVFVEHFGAGARRSSSSVSSWSWSSAVPVLASEASSSSPLRPPTSPSAAQRMQELFRAEQQPPTLSLGLSPSLSLGSTHPNPEDEEDEQDRRSVGVEQHQQQEQEQEQEQVSMSVAPESELSFWLRDVLPRFSVRRHSRAVQQLLLRQGVPATLRAQLWQTAIDNALLITPHLFEVLQCRAVQVGSEEVGASSVGREGSMSYIEMDLERTFPSLTFFRDDEEKRQQLRTVLQSFCCYRPDIGYVQGLSFIAGNLLLYLDAFHAFSCLSNLLATPFMYPFVRMDRATMVVRFGLLEDLLRAVLPNLYKHLQSHGIEVEMFALDWFLTLFSKRLALDVVARIWDLILVLGPQWTYPTAVAILKCLEDRLLSSPFESCMKLLQELPKTLDATTLLRTISLVRVPSALQVKISRLTRISDVQSAQARPATAASPNHIRSHTHRNHNIDKYS